MHRRGLFLESVDQVKIMLNAGKMYSESSQNLIQDLRNNSLDMKIVQYGVTIVLAEPYCAEDFLYAHNF